MPLTLKNLGYHDLFFITHDGQFDNAEGFLRANGFDEVYTESDYPSEKALSTLGIPDDYMFEYSIPVLSKLSAEGKTFFCGYMTGSNHHPFIFPPWASIHFKGKNDGERMVEYCDWSIGKFLKLASKESWYNNTLFVFVADHGMAVNPVYDMPITYNHCPLIFFAPGLKLPPKTYDCMASQMDIFPTVMDLLSQSYTNNTMGIDLLKEKRPFAFFTADDKIGCTDKEYFFVHRNNGAESMYRYKNLETTDVLSQNKAKADSMRAYAYSMLQTAQWIVEKEKFCKK
jgi:phosphoglycerol transferase MdoB-like AlkP superfamily enzyme